MNCKNSDQDQPDQRRRPENFRSWMRSSGMMPSRMMDPRMMRSRMKYARMMRSRMMNQCNMPRHFHPRRRWGGLLFFWFVLVFGFMGVLIFGGISFVTYLLSTEEPIFTNASGISNLLIPGLCLFVPLLFLAVAQWSRSRISNPLARILEAAEAITEGDLSTRIPEKAHGPFSTVEQAFNRMIAELERSDQQRRDLTADIAHDLNTPIHIIRGYLEGIADGIYPPDEETINTLLDETNLLSRLVDDLRTLTLADAGELPLHPEEIDLVEFLSDIQTSFSGQAEEAGVIIALDAEPDLMLFADPDRMDRIVSNLVANALRNTPQGGQVLLGAAQIGDSIELVVADTGIGISAEDLTNIFDRFWRKDKSRDRKNGGGHGLGLSIVKQLVVAQGGTVEVVSAPQEGTCFTLRFPVY